MYYKYMFLLNILSAGAAQSVVQTVMADFTRDTGNEVAAEFGAVGAMKAKAVGGTGAPVDVIVLTDTLIDELIAQVDREFLHISKTGRDPEVFGTHGTCSFNIVFKPPRN